MRPVLLACLALLACAAPATAASPLLPFPDDRHTKADPTTDTGRRLDLQLLDMPRNVANKPVDPTDINRNDGFSPGTPILVKVPGLETQEAFERSGLVPITDMQRAFDKKQPAVVIDTTTGKRHPIWAELDANPQDPADRVLIIRPARNFEEGRRYVVALRGLAEAPAEFAAYRDGEQRSARYDRICATLSKAKIARGDLFLAWDFTVASERSLSERMLHIRDDAFAQLGDTNLADLKVEGSAPRHVITKTEDFPEGPIARRVEGRMVVPCYLDQPGCPPGSKFLYGLDGMPTRIPGNTAVAPFWCNIPRWVMESGGAIRKARPAIYGHGLLGSGTQVDGGSKRALANEHGFVMCATDWAGMAQEDIPNAAAILTDLSRFNTLADRVQQGMLNFLYLGRSMIHPDGLAGDPAFMGAIDTSRLYYDGGSQGGIIGGALTAVAPDFTRATLGVPGMNYSTLLQRSIDFDTYAQVMYQAYPEEIDRQLLFALVQQLWDRAEANGYAHHMTTDPYANTPRHEVLLGMAYGDHQVANITTEVEARTIGARIRQPALDPGRSPDVEPYWGIDPIKAFPFAGSALFVWDVGPLRTEDGEVKGTNPPPTTNTPNREGVDPHGPDYNETVPGRRQISAFLSPAGTVIDPCGAAPCYLDGYTGPAG